MSPALLLIFQSAGEEFAVPPELLEALCWEATRCDPEAASAWGGYGLYDFREDDEVHGPGIELASTLLELSPDEVMVSPEQQVRAAAALLHHYAPEAETDDLQSWGPALQAFSHREEPHLQRLYLATVYGALDFTPDWEALALELPAFPAPAGDFYGNDAYQQAHSSNYTNASRSAGNINYVVIHTTQGSYSGAISWFQNSASNVSAHYIIRSSDGHTTQMLLEEDIGWHAGNWTYNEQSVGIEHEGWVDDASWYTEPMYKASAELTADICDRNNIPLDRSHVIAHSEVPGSTHTDPGNNWDWDHYMDLIGGEGGPTENAEMLGVIADSDIYEGDRLVGVTVTLDQTGEKTTTDGDGYYRFDGLGTGTWSVTVTADGFDDGTCAKDITTGSGQWWCSIAMVPSDDPVDTEEPVDTEDSGEPDINPGDGHAPGEQARIGGCSTGAFGGSIGLLLLGLLAVRRRS
jgi:hypothetical protein